MSLRGTGDVSLFTSVYRNILLRLDRSARFHFIFSLGTFKHKKEVSTECVLLVIVQQHQCVLPVLALTLCLKMYFLHTVNKTLFIHKIKTLFIHYFGLVQCFRLLYAKRARMQCRPIQTQNLWSICVMAPASSKKQFNVLMYKQHSKKSLEPMVDRGRRSAACH